MTRCDFENSQISFRDTLLASWVVISLPQSSCCCCCYYFVVVFICLGGGGGGGGVCFVSV